MAKYIKINNVSIKRSFVLNKLVQHLNDNEMPPLFLFSHEQCVCANEITQCLKVPLFHKPSKKMPTYYYENSIQ